MSTEQARRGRPWRGDARRDQRVEFLLTSTERDALQQCAHAYQLSVSDLVRAALAEFYESDREDCDVVVERLDGNPIPSGGKDAHGRYWR